MLNFQRIICIWICCVSCMFGTTQLSTLLVQAVPYEYFDDHDQSFYDLDTEQIQAKYDTRLLSQQMLPTENLKGFHNSAAMATFNEDDGGGDGGHRSALDGRKQNNDGFSLFGSTEKFRSNDGSAATSVDDDDDDEIHNDWLEQQEETATMAASSTSTFTEPLDELHLPRAASCFTNGQKYTHGQKVPRLDNCEVCLCMDGEIFCWWEKCDKKSVKASITYDDFSTPYGESSTTRMQLNPKTTFKTTLKPIKKPKTRNEDYKYDDDDSAEIREMQQEYEGLKEQLLRDEHEYEQESADSHTQKQAKTHNMQMVKKKIYQQQQEEEKHKKKIKEPNQNRKQQEQKQQQQKQLKSNEHYEQHHHAHNHNSNSNNNNNRHHDKSSSGSSSKILNFPENLPSVLYYDYKTEEHHQHQHQHREQHLKHQKQKQQQHEKELKQRQQQQQQKLLQQQQQQLQGEQQYHHNNRHHEYGQDFHTYKSPNGLELGMIANDGSGPSTTFKYFSNGNDNIFNEDLRTDSDILPEPPTKKPKFLTSIADTMATTETPLSQLYRSSTVTTAAAEISTTPNGKLTKPPTILTSSTPLKKQILSPWDSDKPKSGKDNGNSKSTTNNESTEDLMDTEDQDDAFHRWLTSTETNNKNNFTLKETTSRNRGFDSSNSDYNGDERIYESNGFDTDAGLSSTIGNTDNTITAMATGSTKNTEAAVALIYDDIGAKANGMYENIQHFNDNNRLSGNSNEIINSNGYDSNYNSAFSQTFQNSNKNNNQLSTASGSSSGGLISSTTSSEDNSVASVVNIDIMLTASSAEAQQQNINFQTINQQQQQIEQQLQNFEHEKQMAKTHDKFMQPPHLISNTNDAAATSAVDNNNRLSFIENDNNSRKNKDSNFTNIVGGNPTKEIQNMGVNLPNNNNSSSINDTNNNSATSYSSSDSFKFKNSPTNTTSTTVVTSDTTSTTPPTLSTTSSPERQCNVMGTMYKIGDVLPQDTGNCLQCICIDGSTSDDTPRVTCSPHNCPPLVLPDLFDATGY